MRRLAWFLIGALALLLVEIAGAMVFLSQSHGLTALAQPNRVERWLAAHARDFAMPADAQNQTNPVPDTPEALAEGRAHWADHCAICHANDGSGEVPIGTRLYPSAPDMRTQGTQHMSDGELFYIIENGVRLTGMPGWGGPGSRNAEDSWKLVRFIRHLPNLTFEERKQMEKLNPKGPDDLREEQEEEKFLKGEDTPNEPPAHHHH
jgi:mono/diheme cytochrome c family protein